MASHDLIIDEELQPTARDPFYRNLLPYQASV